MFYNFKKYLSSSTSSNEELDESEEVVEIKEQQHSEPRPKAQVEPMRKNSKLITTAGGHVIPRPLAHKFTIPKLLR